METEKITVLDENNVEREADVLLSFTSEEFKKDYIIYTFNESKGDLTKIMVSTIIENDDSYSFEDIETEEEWDFIKKTMKEISKIDKEVANNGNQ